MRVPAIVVDIVSYQCSSKIPASTLRPILEQYDVLDEELNITHLGVGFAHLLSWIADLPEWPGSLKLGNCAWARTFAAAVRGSELSKLFVIQGDSLDFNPDLSPEQREAICQYVAEHDDRELLES